VHIFDFFPVFGVFDLGFGGVRQEESVVGISGGVLLRLK
jgi:hypothetical protein